MLQSYARTETAWKKTQLYVELCFEPNRYWGCMYLYEVQPSVFIGVPYLHTQRCNSNVRVSAVTSVLHSYSTTPDPSFLTALFYVVLIMHNSPSSTGVKSWSVFWLLYRITHPRSSDGDDEITADAQSMEYVRNRLANHASASANMRHRATHVKQTGHPCARDQAEAAYAAAGAWGQRRVAGGAVIPKLQKRHSYKSCKFHILFYKTV